MDIAYFHLNSALNCFKLLTAPRRFLYRNSAVIRASVVSYVAFVFFIVYSSFLLRHPENIPI